MPKQTKKIVFTKRGTIPESIHVHKIDTISFENRTDTPVEILSCNIIESEFPFTVTQRVPQSREINIQRGLPREKPYEYEYRFQDDAPGNDRGKIIVDPNGD